MARDDKGLLKPLSSSPSYTARVFWDERSCKWYFEVLARNKKVVAISAQGYTTKYDAERVVTAVCRISRVNVED